MKTTTDETNQIAIRIGVIVPVERTKSTTGQINDRPDIGANRTIAARTTAALIELDQIDAWRIANSEAAPIAIMPIGGS